MKKSIFGPGLMFLGATLLVVSLLMSSPKAYSGLRVQDGGSSTPTPAPSSNSPTPGAQSSGAILIDPTGAIIALMGDSGGDGLPGPDALGNILLNLKPSTSPVPANVTLSPSVTQNPDWLKLTQNGVYFPVYVPPNSAGSSPVAAVKVPASTLVGFCSGGYYDKATGKCSNGQFPYKMVPLNSLSDPAAQTPTIVCQAPTVPTWNPAMKKWNCIVPAGFKTNL